MDFFQRCSICSMVSDSGIVLKMSHANVSLKCPAHWWSTLRVFFLKWAQLSLASSSLWTFADLGVAKIRSLDLKPHWDCWSVGSCMLDFASPISIPRERCCAFSLSAVTAVCLNLPDFSQELNLHTFTKVFTGLHAVRLFVTVLPRSFLLVLPQKIAAHFTPCESFRGKHTARSLYTGGVTVCDIVTPRPRTWDLRDLVFLIWFSFEACCSTRELTKHLPQVSQFELCLPCWKSPASHSVQQAILVAGDNRV